MADWQLEFATRSARLGLRGRIADVFAEATQFVALGLVTAAFLGASVCAVQSSSNSTRSLAVVAPADDIVAVSVSFRPRTN